MYRHIDDRDDTPLQYPMALGGLGEWYDPTTWGSWNPFATETAKPAPVSAPSRASLLAKKNSPPPVIGAQTPTNPDAVRFSPDPETRKLSARAGDLESFGGISASDRARINDLLIAGRKADAEALISEKENLIQYKKSQTLFGKIDGFLPDGYKLSESIIKGVPNLVLYGGVTVFALATIHAIRRKK